jgi:hypothetical protein
MASQVTKPRLHPEEKTKTRTNRRDWESDAMIRAREQAVRMKPRREPREDPNGEEATEGGGSIPDGGAGRGCARSPSVAGTATVAPPGS